MKRYFYILVLVVFSLVIPIGCARNTFKTYNPEHPNSLIELGDSTDLLGIREALDSLEFYVDGTSWRRVTYGKGSHGSPVYDLFVHNGDVILHGNHGNDWIGKLSDAKIQYRKKGKFDYFLTMRMTGKEKYTKNHVSLKIKLFLYRNSDRISLFITHGATGYYELEIGGRLKELRGDIDKYYLSYFNRR